MKRLIPFIVVFFLALANVLPASAATFDLNERLKGFFVLSVEQHGELFYLDSELGFSTYVASPTETWNLIKQNMTGITNADLVKIPTKSYTYTTRSGRALRDRFLGQFLLAVEDHGEVWYVSPLDGFRHYLGTGEATFDNVKFLALGANLNDIQTIKSYTDADRLFEDFIHQPATGDADQYPYLKIDQIQASLGSIEYTDAEMGWEFASTLWSAYNHYNRDFGNYPEIKWFEAGFKYNLPINFDESGFSLDRNGLVYWTWDNLSLEFFKMFYHNFEMSTPGDGTAAMKFTLPAGVNTAQVGYLSAGTYYFDTQFGFQTALQYKNNTAIEANDDVVQDNPSFDLDQVKANLNTVEYTDAEMGWEFASTLWAAYQEYNAEFGNYPEIKWFESGLEFNAPIYFDDSGFTLDASDDTLWMWGDFSSEFFKMYFENFSMNTPGNGIASMSITLPSAIDTQNYGILQAGTYYFSSVHGFMTQEMYEQTNEYRRSLPLDEMDLDAEADRIVGIVLAVQEAVRQYHNEIGLFPGAFEQPIVLGENGVTTLYKQSGFYPSTMLRDPAYIIDIESGAPSTDIVYDSANGRLNYVISFTLLGESQDYEPGMYEVTPLAFQRVGPVPQS